MKSICLIFFIISIEFYAQDFHVLTGRLTDANGVGLTYANILVLQPSDSILVRGTVTLEDGFYRIENLNNGNYVIMASMVGYQSTYSSTIQLISDYKMPTLVLNEGEALDEVIVEATKPLYQQKVDRMVINVENSIVSAGGSALEILERSPGVIVDRQSNSISVIGKNGVVVMINGKINYLPGSAVVQLLDGMSASNIQSIELITTPPANFDAEGNAGYINIVLKERTDVGLNGSFSLSYGLGGHGYVTSNNINFNYRKNKVNIFGNYSYSSTAQRQIFYFNQVQVTNNDVFSKETETVRDPQKPVQNIRIGVDYEITDKTIIGLILNAVSDKHSMEGAMTNSRSATNGTPTEFIELQTDEVNHWKHFDANFNIMHHFSKNKYINFDALYLVYEDNNPIDYLTKYYDGNNDFLYDELTRSRKLTPIKRWVNNFDYSNQINDKVKFETGVKAAFSIFDNDVSVENLEENEWVFDPTLTNKSDLSENIYAAYIAADYIMNDKWSSKIGLRYEYTDTQLITNTEGTVVDRKYGDFFPTFFLNRKFSDDLNMNLSYNKRITRPTFTQMAPFVIMWDPNIFTTGNVEIQPSISNSIKFDINYKSAILSIQYTLQDSPIARFQVTYDDLNDRLILRSENYDQSKLFSTTIGAPFKLTIWWRTQNNLTFSYQEISGVDSDKTFFILSNSSFRINSTSVFKITDNIRAEISALYQGPQYTGTSKFDNFYKIDIGVQKTFSNDWGSLQLGIDDVFDSYKFNRITNIQNQNMEVVSNFKFSHRTFKFTYSRSFGNSKLKSAREREARAAQERRRIN